MYSDYEDDDDYDYGAGEPIFKPSVYARERVGAYGDEWIPNVVQKDRKKGQYYTREEKFELSVESMAKKLNIPFSKLKILLPPDLSLKIQNIKFLNAQAYVLGFIASNDGTGPITKTSFDNAIQHLGTRKVFDSTVKPEDVLRYARLWVNFNSS